MSRGRSPMAAALVAAVVLGAACGGAPSAPLAGAARWPASADTFDPVTGTGCRPLPTFELCEVTGSGSTGTRCTDACSPSQYALECRGPPAPAAGPVPEPAAALGCTAIPIPTPASVLVHCCAGIR